MHVRGSPVAGRSSLQVWVVLSDCMSLSPFPLFCCYYIFKDTISISKMSQLFVCLPLFLQIWQIVVLFLVRHWTQNGCHVSIVRNFSLKQLSCKPHSVCFKKTQKSTIFTNIKLCLPTWFLFQHCIVCVSQHPTNQTFEKFNLRNYRIWLVKNTSFYNAHDACDSHGVSVILWTRL